MEDNKKIDQKENVPWWQPSILLFVQLSGWIVVPIIIAVFLGQWLDQKYNTKPWLFLATVIVAFTVSMIGLVKEATGAIKQMEKFNNKDLTKKDGSK